MKVDVSEILKVPGASISFEVRGELGEVDSEGGLRADGPFVARGVATSIGDGVYVEAHANGNVTMLCSRCLTRFSKAVNVSCEGKFVENPQVREDDEVGVYPLEGEFCDLAEMVRQEIVLNRPMKPLCTPSCKGLCQVCGQNLNERDCGCVKTEASVTAFGRKLLEAVDERGKRDGRS